MSRPSTVRARKGRIDISVCTAILEVNRAPDLLTIAAVLSMVKFVGWSIGVLPAEAWLSPGALDLAARCAANRRRIAEIGVWQGAVTCRMRAAMNPDGQLFAIDPYPAGRLGINYQRIIARGEVDKVARGEVVWLRETGAQAAANPRVLAAAPFDFVFVDADHTMAGLTENWDGWTPLVAPGGLIALRENGRPGGPSAHGVPRFSDTVARADGRFEVFKGFEDVLVLRRKGGSADMSSA